MDSFLEEDLHILHLQYALPDYDFQVRIEWKWLLQKKLKPWGVACLKHDSAWLKKGETWCLHAFYVVGLEGSDLRSLRCIFFFFISRSKE